MCARCIVGAGAGALILLAALVGAIAHGDGFNLHLVYAPLVEADGAGHGGAYINDAAAVEGTAVVHAHQAAFAGGNAGDPYCAGQGQGAVGGIHATVWKFLAQGTAGVGSLVERGFAYFMVLQCFLNSHGTVTFAVHCIGALFQLGFRAGVCSGRALESAAPGTPGAGYKYAGCQSQEYDVSEEAHDGIVSDMLTKGNNMYNLQQIAC